MTKNNLFKKITFNDSLVNITVFGPGYGESIIIYLPGLGWSVIDSCSIKIKGKTFNPALEFLKSLNVKHLAFIALTHPHLDHYKGLDDIILYFLGSIDRICYYSGEGMREYATYLTRKSILKEPGLKTLSSIFDLFKKAKAKGSRIIKISERTAIIRRGNYNGHVIEVLSLSPSEESETKYIERLYNYIPKNKSAPISDLKDGDHNLVSSAIWCRIDDQKFIFGSDLENGSSEQSGWNGVINDMDAPDLSANLVKIPHHGSSNAFQEKTWKFFSKSTTPISIVTPYSKSHTPLPDQKILEKINEFSKSVYITSKAKFEKPHKIYKDIPFEQLYGIKDWRYIKFPQQIGYISTSMKPDDTDYCKVVLQKPALKFNIG